jgi:DNA-binding CsgD family transcriptional regulator
VGALEEEPTGIAQLTDRQREVLLLVGMGYSNIEIATRLGVTAKAIEYHRAGIRRALAINTQAGLYRLATRYAERVERQPSEGGR